MPIKPENKARYPKDWKQIRSTILQRAGHRCEQCDLPNHALGFRKDGEFIFLTDRLKEAGYKNGDVLRYTDSKDRLHEVKVIMIVLTIAHLDHTPENCAPENLKAWCQKCHLNYDHEHHKKNSAETRRLKLNNQDMFEPAVCEDEPAKVDW